MVVVEGVLVVGVYVEIVEMIGWIGGGYCIFCCVGFW